MSDVLLTAVGLLEKLHAEKGAVLARDQSNHEDQADWQALAEAPDQLDRALATTDFDFRQIVNGAARNKLERVTKAIARITRNPAEFDVCQGSPCLGDGRISHERLALVPWTDTCGPCAGCVQSEDPDEQ